MGFTPSLDPPKSPWLLGDFEKTPVPPWLLGDFEKTPVPPFLRGARGDLALIVKQQSLTGFNVKLTLRRARLTLRGAIGGCTS
jgi:hypothetical protein